MAILNPAQPETAAAQQTFLHSLRMATDSAHKQLEESELSKRLLAPGVRLADYIAYLQRMQPVIAFADDALLPFLQPILSDASERRKAQWLQADLQMLNAFPFQPSLFQPFQPTSTGYTLGFFYVIEGSVLGGRVLLKSLQKLLPVTAENGGRFFASYGEATSEKWKAFLSVFAGYVVQHGAEAEAIAGATDAFTSIQKHFAR